MRHFAAGTIFLSALITQAFAQSHSPFLGRWDFNTETPGKVGANWLGVKETGGKLDVWFQPTGGHVYQVKDVKAEGSHLHMVVSPASDGHRATIWELDANGEQLTGTQNQGDKSIALTGVRAPKLTRSAPRAWGSPEALFNGKDLDGWEPLGEGGNHWVVKDGLLVNEAHGANLKSTRQFEDFKVHFEVNCPEDANSGFYLHGRYELQLEYGPVTPDNPPNRRMGAIYGRLTPSVELPRKPGTWDVFDVTLVGRKVTVVRNGVTTINQKEIEGITGGALDANEGQPGPFYIQGDHTGGLKFRNITVAVPKS